MRSVLAVAVFMALVPGPAQAVPITVSAGDFVTFNFDLTGATPPPPYVLAGVSTNTTGLDFEPCDVGQCELLDIGVWTFWTDLNGTGDVFASAQANLGGLFHTEMRDGVFSATLQMTEGAITVDPVACGVSATGARTSGCPEGPLPSAPEPATLALLAVAGVGAYFRRRA
jgi:hypothetical protein